MNDFSERVFQVVREIPRGKVTNYGFVAFAAGNPRASRGAWALCCTATRTRKYAMSPRSVQRRLCARDTFSAAPMYSARSASKPRAYGFCPTVA